GLITPASTGPFHGPAEQWVEQIHELVEGFGMNGFIYWPEQDHERQLALFAREVAPALRQL
ncbi:LLM class flavin-dependent oxidoreductase, partial [Streptomyces sp. NPDC023588]